jgi:hypothetical protein
VDFIAVVKRFLHRLGVIASAELAPGVTDLSKSRTRQADEHFQYVLAGEAPKCRGECAAGAAASVVARYELQHGPEAQGIVRRHH